MKKILLLILLFAGITSAKAELPKTLVGMDVGISQKNIPVNIDLLYGKFQFGVGIELLYNKGTEGVDCTDVLNIEYFGQRLSGGSYYFPINLQVGYNVYKNLIVGAGFGIAKKTIYENFFEYNIYHIIGDDNFYVTEKDGTKAQLKVFASYLIPFNINNRSFFKIHTQYCTISKLGVGVGFMFTL